MHVPVLSMAASKTQSVPENDEEASGIRSQGRQGRLPWEGCWPGRGTEPGAGDLQQGQAEQEDTHRGMQGGGSPDCEPDGGLSDEASKQQGGSEDREAPPACSEGAERGSGPLPPGAPPLACDGEGSRGQGTLLCPWAWRRSAVLETVCSH